MNPAKKLSIGLLIALVGFPQISETIYTPALPNVAEGLLTSPYMVEATLSIYFLGFSLGVLLWGIISDSLGRRKAMLAGLSLYGLATLACGSSLSIEALLGWRFFQAFGASVGSVITQTILRDAFDGNERTKLFSVMSGALAFSPAIGPLLGGFISEFFGWRANFWALSILAVCLFVWSFVILPETKPAHICRLSSRKVCSLLFSMMTSRRLWGHALLVGAANGIVFGFYQEAPFVFIEQMGMHPGNYGCFGILIAAAAILAARASYRQSGKLSSELIIQYGTLVVCLAAGLFLILVLTGVFYVRTVGIGIAILLLFLLYFGIGLIIPNSLSNALKPFQSFAGTAGSIFGGFYYLLIAGSTWMMGMLHNGTALSLPLYIALLAIGLALGSFLIRKQRAEAF